MIRIVKLPEVFGSCREPRYDPLGPWSNPIEETRRQCALFFFFTCR